MAQNMVKVPDNTPDVDNAVYRFERKFFVSHLSSYEIESLLKLHPAFFSEIYHKRSVNNIYFDNCTMQSFTDNVRGVKDRLKFRIRWYGNLWGLVAKPTLELKIKKGLCGRKRSFSFIPFMFEKGCPVDEFKTALKNSQIPEIIKSEFNALQPSLVNRYHRKYYQSLDGHYRITIDSGMEYYSIKRSPNYFLQSTKDSVNTIVELKYNQDKDGMAERISNFFPFRMTKSSKYVTGIESIAL